MGNLTFWPKYTWKNREHLQPKVLVNPDVGEKSHQCYYPHTDCPWFCTDFLEKMCVLIPIVLIIARRVILLTACICAKISSTWLYLLNALMIASLAQNCVRKKYYEKKTSHFLFGYLDQCWAQFEFSSSLSMSSMCLYLKNTGLSLICQLYKYDLVPVWMLHIWVCLSESCVSAHSPNKAFCYVCIKQHIK